MGPDDVLEYALCLIFCFGILGHPVIGHRSATATTLQFPHDRPKLSQLCCCLVAHLGLPTIVRHLLLVLEITIASCAGQ